MSEAETNVPAAEAESPAPEGIEPATMPAQDDPAAPGTADVPEDAAEVPSQPARSSDLDASLEEVREWIEEAEPKALMSMPFDTLKYVSDNFEMAMVALYKKGWGYGRILFMHYFFFAPIMELPIFPYPRTLSWKTCLIRFFIILFCNASLYLVVLGLLGLIDHPELIPMFAMILTAVLFTFHTMLAWETSTVWRNAHKRLHKVHLNELLPEKKKKTKRPALRKKPA